MRVFTELPPLEAFKQTNKIKRSLDRWLTNTDIVSIRNTVAQPSQITQDMTAEEKRAAVDSFRERQKKQQAENLSKMFDAVFEKHPEETVELMALICCVDPKEASSFPLSEYIVTISHALMDENAMSFFTLLQQLAQAAIPGR